MLNSTVWVWVWVLAGCDNRRCHGVAQISMAWKDAVDVTTAVLGQRGVLPAGLGARDRCV